MGIEDGRCSEIHLFQSIMIISLIPSSDKSDAWCFWDDVNLCMWSDKLLVRRDSSEESRHTETAASSVGFPFHFFVTVAAVPCPWIAGAAGSKR